MSQSTDNTAENETDRVTEPYSIREEFRAVPVEPDESDVSSIIPNNDTQTHIGQLSCMSHCSVTLPSGDSVYMFALEPKWKEVDFNILL